jgi:hypothetical protein
MGKTSAALGTDCFSTQRSYLWVHQARVSALGLEVLSDNGELKPSTYWLVVFPNSWDDDPI